jgi:hypothetical protein
MLVGKCAARKQICKSVQEAWCSAVAVAPRKHATDVVAAVLPQPLPLLLLTIMARPSITEGMPSMMNSHCSRHAEGRRIACRH